MSRFYRKDYEMVARIISDTRKTQRMAPSGLQDIRGLTLDVVTERFVAEFAADNPRFQAGKFRGACGYEK